ncbi:MAG: haloacid dehalogenase-like hydrolase [Bacteroidales bacterium]|nr:haloacid dehalogenase-like hydrolase [Bacteroidales bacterium]
MRKFPFICLTILFLAVVISGCSKRKALPEDNWDPAVHIAITRMIDQLGKGSKDYDPKCKPYAVFDFDNTTIIGDIALTTMAYQIEHMDFGFTKENIYEKITLGIPDLDSTLKYGDPSISVTSRELALDIEKDYALISERYLEGRETPDLESMHASEEYLDFRAKLWGLSLGVDNTFDYATGCIWINTLFDGMETSQMQDVVRRNLDLSTQEPSLTEETWESPDGKMRVIVTKGLRLPPESVHLYNTLRKNGFDVYICTASLEQLVETMACDPSWGLGVKEEEVYGIRLAPSSDGKIRAIGDSTYVQTFREGKTACIKRFLVPSHGGKGPAFIAGDSNGDYSMLTSFPEDLNVGLILDVPRTGNIQNLKEKAIPTRDAVLKGKATSPAYVVQGRDPSRMEYIKSNISVE